MKFILALQFCVFLTFSYSQQGRAVYISETDKIITTAETREEIYEFSQALAVNKALLYDVYSVNIATESDSLENYNLLGEEITHLSNMHNSDKIDVS